ncbi:MAG: DUF1080 domain-containing protein [Planctomycetes bacterium]|nr:DUF1080 domain-containing protein [Planctomycetota bacterium]
MISLRLFPILFFTLATLLIFSATVAPLHAEQEACWQDLFDGKTLNGWIQKNGTATYQVVEGTIVGKTSEGSPNSFLCSEKRYGDFELEFFVRVHNELNSGVQIRSTTEEVSSEDETAGKFGAVNGPQVEIEAGGAAGAEAGYVYGESTGRGWLTPEDQRTPHKHFRDGQWNHFRIVAQGPRIQTWINGESIGDLTDEEIFNSHPKGFIGLQVHSISAGQGPFDVTWKQIRIKDLSAK